MAKTFDYDLLVLGGGSAGYAGARTAAGLGLKTAVVDGSEELGGLCILRGCMPTKALLHASELVHDIKEAEAWGIKAGKVTIDFARVMARKDFFVRDFADYRAGQLQKGAFDLIRDHARFTDPHTLQLSGGRSVRARNFLICTGSVVAPPPLPALSKIDYLDSDSALKLKKLPRSMIILGGGAVSCEFAQFFSRLGCSVTLIQRGAQLLKEFDSEAAEVVEKIFTDEGIRLFTGTEMTDAGKSSRGLTIGFKWRGKRQAVTAETVFFGLGRIPNTAGLGLDKIGVNCVSHRVITNLSMASSQPHIYAAGDCAGPYEIVHIAIQQAEIAAWNIRFPRKNKAIDYRLLMSVVFTDPQAASVGLTEKEARVQNIPVVTASYPFADHGKSMILGKTRGFVKLLAHHKTREIVGGTCVGPMAGDLIHEITAAMAGRLTARQFAAMPHYHPTLAEIWSYPAEELAGL